MKQKLKDKIGVIVLTYNRPKYIKRCIDSLFLRANYPFDLYVFDDGSDEETISVLKSLQTKYGFMLSRNKQRSNIAVNFCNAITTIPDDYRYYVKLDSDVELLTDDLFSQAIEVFGLKTQTVNKVSGVSPRTEGVFRFERYPEDVEFYNGHAIRTKTSVCFGCCMFFTNEVFSAFRRYAEDIVRLEPDVKFGIDTKLYDVIMSFGSYITIEDLSVYHIDNSFGQRKDFDYFTTRKRWGIIDYEDVWYLHVSKILHPRILTKKQYSIARKLSTTYEEFVSNCKEYVKDKKRVEDRLTEKQQQEIEHFEEKKPVILSRMYKITSPANYRPDSNLQHGTYKYFKDLPDWARNNPRLVVERVIISDEEIEIHNK